MRMHTAVRNRGLLGLNGWLLMVAVAALIAWVPDAARAAEVDDFIAPGQCAGRSEALTSGMSEKSWCEQGIKTYRKWYPLALKGDYQGQRNVAFCLITGCDGAVTINKPLGCAWRAVILVSGSRQVDQGDVMNFDSHCRGKLTQSEAMVAGSQYAALFQRIYRRTAPAFP